MFLLVENFNLTASEWLRIFFFTVRGIFGHPFIFFFFFLNVYTLFLLIYSIGGRVCKHWRKKRISVPALSSKDSFSCFTLLSLQLVNTLILVLAYIFFSNTITFVLNSGFFIFCRWNFLRWRCWGVEMSYLHFERCQVMWPKSQSLREIYIVAKEKLTKFYNIQIGTAQAHTKQSDLACFYKIFDYLIAEWHMNNNIFFILN